MSKKSELQEYCQQQKWELPVYTTTLVGGEGHCPRFISSVLVKNKTFVTKESWPKKKSAELAAAELAINNIKVEEDIHQMFPLMTNQGKNDLQEYSVKKFKVMPCYVTKREGEWGFRSTVTIGEFQFAGTAAVRKKEAEKSAAQAALKFFKENSIPPSNNNVSNQTTEASTPIANAEVQTFLNTLVVTEVLDSERETTNSKKEESGHDEVQVPNKTGAENLQNGPEKEPEISHIDKILEVAFPNTENEVPDGTDKINPGTKASEECFKVIKQEIQGEESIETVKEATFQDTVEVNSTEVNYQEGQTPKLEEVPQDLEFVVEKGAVEDVGAKRQLLDSREGEEMTSLDGNKNRVSKIRRKDVGSNSLL